MKFSLTSAIKPPTSCKKKKRQKTNILFSSLSSLKYNQILYNTLHSRKDGSVRHSRFPPHGCQP